MIKPGRNKTSKWSSGNIFSFRKKQASEDAVLRVHQLQGNDVIDLVQKGAAGIIFLLEGILEISDNYFNTSTLKANNCKFVPKDTTLHIRAQHQTLLIVYRFSKSKFMCGKSFADGLTAPERSDASQQIMTIIPELRQMLDRLVHITQNMSRLFMQFEYQCIKEQELWTLIRAHYTDKERLAHFLHDELVPN